MSCGSLLYIMPRENTFETSRFQAVTAHKMARIYTKTSLIMGRHGLKTASKRPEMKEKKRAVSRPAQPTNGLKQELKVDI